MRDFAFPLSHPHHYGPPPNSGLSTPASETRRLSDPAVADWGDAKEQWSAHPPWTAENNGASSYSREQLPAMTFADGGPPYSEDEDLHSPVVTTSRHKKNKSSNGKSSGDHRGSFVGLNRDGSETYYVNEGNYEDEADGPGGELVTYPPDQAQHSHLMPDYQQYSQRPDERGIYGESESDEDDPRFSRNYSFTIASPDEEMHGKAVALFDFTSEHENELPLKEGQVILVSYRHGQGWLVAEDPKTGESGLVPEEFVRLLRDIEGGLNGLQRGEGQPENLNVVPPSNGIPENVVEASTPVSGGVSDLIATPTNPSSDWPKQQAAPHTSNNSSGGAVGGAVNVSGMSEKEKMTAVQSTFSTSSRDLDPYPLPLHGVVGKDKENEGAHEADEENGNEVDKEKENDRDDSGGGEGGGGGGGRVGGGGGGGGT